MTHALSLVSSSEESLPFLEGISFHAFQTVVMNPHPPDVSPKSDAAETPEPRKKQCNIMDKSSSQNPEEDHATNLPLESVAQLESFESKFFLVT